ncbi:MAG: hypothetical protein H7145_00315 [Akkermansiaceae bacterium]|nr:hypothetical protein [Armatimonadota bacterium]
MNSEKSPEEWYPAVARVVSLPVGATVLILGGTDTGKTTFAAQVARVLAGDSERIAVVDADIGQSEIAPPGTVGVAWARPDAERLSDLKPAGTFFVGAFSASTLPLEHASATAQAVRHARERNAERVLVDTSGYVTGPTARRLKCAKASLIQPALILAFGADNNSELLALAQTASAVCGAELLAVPVPEGVQKKPAAQRTTRRQTRLAAYFGEKPTAVTVPLDEIVTLGATLGTGISIAPHLAQWAGDALHMPVVHGEMAGDVMTLFLGNAARPGWEGLSGAVADHFKARTVRVVSLSAHLGVLVGLHDESGRLFALGRYAGFDEESVGIVVTVPGGAAIHAQERTRLLSFGRVRTDERGATIAELKPNEL